MLIKNKSLISIILFFIFLNLNINSFADEFNIIAKEVSIDKSNEIVIGKGDVKVEDSDGKIITAEKVIYEKKKEYLLAEGSAEVIDKEGNILKSDKISYNKIDDIIISYKNSELILKEGYKLKTNKILYNNKEKIVSSDNEASFVDSDGNFVSVEMFQYQIKKNLFSSVGKIKIIDINKNEYFFKELHVDTKKKEMVGSDVSVLLDEKNFGVKDENDPRFFANDIIVTNNSSSFSKGVFTVCKIRDGRCPPWSLQAKKIEHDKIKKTIYYDSAILKVYDVPIFYFPKFFHPDPTVKRQSGFLTPFFTDSSSIGTGFALPYYWAINNSKDLTFTPKYYSNENMLFLNEYRQAFRNGFLILDTSFNQGYKNTSSTKTDGSRNHLFAELNLNFAENKNYTSDLSLKIQKTSNDTYFRIHDINTNLVDSENTDLQNQIDYKFSKDNTYLNISATVYENLRDSTNSRYEYILPNILFGKSFFTENFGIIDFKSNALYKNYKVNKHLTSITNDIVWSPASYVTRNGFVNTLKGMIKNTNYNAKRTENYKNGYDVSEISSVLTFKSSLPMKKENSVYSKIFSPNFMIRYAPGHMRNLSSDGVLLKYSNLFSTNKTSVIEDGLSAIVGFDFKTSKKVQGKSTKEKLSLSLGQVFNLEENKDIPSQSSLDQKTSDLVGELNYNFTEKSKINYKFSLDHNYNDLNYNEISTTMNFGKVDFNLDYLEERNHIGTENYINSGIALSLNENNKFKFETKKNFKTNSTELYNISYQYINDCLTAGLVYRREFYEDNDVDKKDTLMFTIKLVPFTGVRTPLISQ